MHASKDMQMKSTNSMLKNAHFKGYANEINKLDDRKCDYNEGLFYACKKGHINIIKLMINKGADDFEWGLYYACLGGHTQMLLI